MLTGDPERPRQGWERGVHGGELSARLPCRRHAAANRFSRRPSSESIKNHTLNISRCAGLLLAGDQRDGGQPGNYRRHLFWDRFFPGTSCCLFSGFTVVCKRQVLFWLLPVPAQGTFYFEVRFSRLTIVFSQDKYQTSSITLVQISLIRAWM